MTFVYSRVDYKNQPCLITIDNMVYDCSGFKDHHPGGDEIMMKYHNKDATEVFHAFHGEAGFEKLKNLASRATPLSNPQAAEPHVLAFRKLRQKLIDEGWFNSNPLWQFYKSAETIGLLSLGLFVAYYVHWFIGALIVGTAYQQLGWLGHDYSHQQVFKNRSLNNFMAYITGTVMSGYSVNWWKERHNSHHAITNVLEGDPDVDNLPLFVWSKDDICRMATIPFSETIIPYQHYYFIPFTFFLKLIWNLQSIFFVQQAHNTHLNKVATNEKFCVILHYSWIALFSIFFLPTWASILGFFFLSELIGGAFIANVVFMNHYACQQMTWNQGQIADFLQLQLNTTRNVEPTPFMNWFCGGLNLQIEHHLFPTMPRHNLIKVKPIVEQFCKENNLMYQSLPFMDCMTEVLGKLKGVAEIVTQNQKKSTQAR